MDADDVEEAVLGVNRQTPSADPAEVEGAVGGASGAESWQPGQALGRSIGTDELTVADLGRRERSGSRCTRPP
jgi:hypothetical protein